MLYVEGGEVQDAIDWLEDCIEVFPREADFYFAAVYCTVGRKTGYYKCRARHGL